MDYVRDTDADPRQEETVFSGKSAGLGKTDAWKAGNALIPKLDRKVEGASGRTQDRRYTVENVSAPPASCNRCRP